VFLRDFPISTGSFQWLAHGADMLKQSKHPATRGDIALKRSSLIHRKFLARWPRFVPCFLKGHRNSRPGGGVTMEHTLFEKYGGFAAISRVVLDLYERLLDDDEVGPFFDNVDMARIVDHQTKFVASLLGGPAHYSDDQIRRMHNHLDIGDLQFDRLKQLLAECLQEHGFAHADVKLVIDAFEARRNLVVE
jgi:hemoglobin